MARASAGVRFEVTRGPFYGPITATAHGAEHSSAFGGTQGRVPREGFRLLAGEDDPRLQAGRRAREGFLRGLRLGVCSARSGRRAKKIAIRLGSLDGEPGIRPQFHTFVASRASWDEIPDDGLPRYDEGHS